MSMDNENQAKKGTMICGIAATENLDSSGERLIISGMDISSIDRGEACFNYEHKSDTPESIVGKIISGKKILKAEDCQDEKQAKYWEKIKVPFLYIVGELFDGVGHKGAMDCAAMMRYDSQNPDQKPTIGFSVEGAKLEKVGQDVTRTCVRKISLTISPCNKATLAETLPTPELKPILPPKSPLDVFKSESTEVEVLTKTAVYRSGVRPSAVHAPEAPKAPAPEFKGIGPSLGQTKSGKDVFAGSHPSSYSGFTPQDHADASNMHYKAAQGTESPMGGKHHLKMVQSHMNQRDSLETRANRFPKAKANMLEGRKFQKGMGVPSAEVNQGASSKEVMIKNMKQEAEEIFSSWNKAQEILGLVVQNNPSLSKSDAEAIAKTVCYKLFKRAERKLSRL